MKRVILIIVGILLILFSSFLIYIYATDDSVDCDDFDQTLYNWFPYKKGTTILLASEKGDSMVVVFDSVTTYHTVSYLKDVKCGGCADDITGYFTLEGKKLSISLETDLKYVSFETIYFNNESIYSNDIPVPIISYSKKNLKYDSLKVFEIKEPQPIKEIYLDKGNGITGIKTMDNFYWQKEKSVPLTIKENITKIREGCK